MKLFFQVGKIAIIKYIGALSLKKDDNGYRVGNWQSLSHTSFLATAKASERYSNNPHLPFLNLS